MSARRVSIEVTPTGFRKLWIMMTQPGRAFTRSELLEGALGEDVYTLERTIDVHVRSIRRKMGEHEHLIETVRGVG
jgi:two-component system phosphate regulon response regulator PhoB